jgi:trehalose-6-phosphate synthase
MSDAVITALNMTRSERQGRMMAARMAVAKNNVYCWAGELLEELGSIALARTAAVPAMRFGTLSANVA